MGYSQFVSGLTHHEPARAFPGLTLFTTMSGDAFNLIDIEGKLVHHWSPPPGLKAYYARGLDNGNLLAQCVDGTEEGGAAGGRAAAALEMDWDGNVVWEYRNPRTHHDHVRRSNGNTILIAAEPLDKETSSRFAHGDPQTKDGSILSESLIEVTPGGETVWEWHAHEHLDPDRERYRIGSGGDQWLHANAVFEMPDGNLVFSFNTLSLVIVIERATGKVLWRLNPGVTLSQHNPTVLDNGHLLLFDNGNGRNHSRILEIDFDTQEIVWEYTANPRDAFYSMNISGAQRLPNGNTLVCEGRSARFFEVTPDRDIVWEYVSPFVFDHLGQRSRAVFRAHRYAPDSGFIRGRA